MPGTLWPQPPTCRAKVPYRSASTTSAAHTVTTATKASTAMARCNRGRRPANSVAAAAIVGISTGSGVNAAAIVTSDPASLLAGPSLGPLVAGQGVELVRLVGVTVDVGLGGELVELVVGLLGHPRVLGIVVDLLGP